MSDFGSVSISQRTARELPDGKASIGTITVSNINTFVYPDRKATFGSVHLSTRKAYLYGIDFGKRLPFMADADISDISITHPEEAAAFEPDPAEPIEINQDFGYDPEGLRVSFSSSVDTVDLITAEAYSVETIHTETIPELELV